MDVYRIGTAAGPHAVGYARNAAEVMGELRTANPGLDGWACQVWEMESGRAMLADRIFRHRNFASMKEPRSEHSAVPPAWYEMTLDQVMADLAEITDLVHPSAIMTSARHVPDPAEYGAAIFRLRTQVFGTTQGMFGEIAGKSVAVVSRWEAGEAKPGLDELLRIRAVAMAFGLPWDDRSILDPKLSDF